MDGGGGVRKTSAKFWGGMKYLPGILGGYEKYVEFLEISSTPLPGIKNDHTLTNFHSKTMLTGKGTLDVEFEFVIKMTVFCKDHSPLSISL